MTRDVRGENPRMFHVTREHIDNACQRDSTDCMLEHAIQEAFGPAATRVTVSIDRGIRFTWQGRRYYFSLLPIPRTALLKFDAGRGDELKPFSFSTGYGYSERSGWTSQRAPGAVRKRYAPAGGKKRPYIVSKYRQYGMCMILSR